MIARICASVPLSLSRLLIAFGFVLGAIQAGQAADPANPNANAKARAILNYLERLPSRSDKRLLSGQFCGCGPGANAAVCKEILEKTGCAPAIIGLDYSDHSKSVLALEYKTVNRAAIEYTRQGGLVTISAHLYNPANPKGGGLRDPPIDLKLLLQPGSEIHERWIKELDVLAAGLKELQNAGVVVLWRPFHEMNGGWFWWGANKPDAFILVWRHMFDYFTKEKQLNNLLWVYSPNHGEKTADYYPGDRYVDIVGLDAYTDFIDPKHVHGYEALAKLPKPFGFTEFGPHNAKDPPGDYDYRRFLKDVRSHFPRATFFLAWDGNWGLHRNHFVKELLTDPWVVNRSDLPPFRPTSEVKGGIEE
jgi:mannan endo-1,4-beta-mannosidase